MGFQITFILFFSFSLRFFFFFPSQRNCFAQSFDIILEVVGVFGREFGLKLSKGWLVVELGVV